MKIIVFGHVDTGKSTLCGQILVNTIEEYATLYKQKKPVLSNLLDIYEEEQVRSKTCEFSQFDVTYDSKEYTFIDTPGHKMYIRQYIEALQQPNIHTGILILSALGSEFESGFEKGTTKEYITLAKCIGVKNLIILINKMDSINYDNVRFNYIKDVITQYIKLFKFKTVHYLSVSGKENKGIFDTGGLFDTLDLSKNMDSSEDVSKCVGEEILTKQVNIRLQIFDCKNIISAGFSCIVHFMSSDIPVESEIMIEKLVGKPFAKKGDTIDIKCTLKCPFNIRKRSKILFRSSDITIGCGIVLD